MNLCKSVFVQKWPSVQNFLLVQKWPCVQKWRQVKICHILDPLENLSRKDYTNIEHHFLNPTIRSSPTAHNSQTYIWKLYKKHEKSTTEWKMLRQINSRLKPNFMCSLCNLERLYIANANKRKILNKWFGYTVPSLP